MNAAEAANERIARETEERAASEIRASGATINIVPAETIAAMRDAVQPLYQSLGTKLEPHLSALRKAALQ
jgi:TRAP-type C4-dicarboxylate transport system substrate-binding protein